MEKQSRFDKLSAFDKQIEKYQQEEQNIGEFL